MVRGSAGLLECRGVLEQTGDEVRETVAVAGHAPRTMLAGAVRVSAPAFTRNSRSRAMMIFLPGRSSGCRRASRLCQLKADQTRDRLVVVMEPGLQDD